MNARGLRDLLRGFLSGRVCVVGVGNRERGDDAIGCIVADALRGRTRAALVDAGTVPENHLERVVRARPETVLIVDAVDLGSEPGTTRLLRPEQVEASGASTHAASIALCAAYLRVRTRARVVLLGVQPGSLRARSGLSPEVACAAVAICNAVARLAPLLAPRAGHGHERGLADTR